MSSVRVAYVCADPGIRLSEDNGSATHVGQFARALAGHGSSVTLFAAAEDEAAAENLGIATVGFGADPDLGEIRRKLTAGLRRRDKSVVQAGEVFALLSNQPLEHELWSRRDEFDLVYERLSLWSYGALRFARSRGIPFVVEVNAPLAEQQEEYRDLDMVETAYAIEAFVLENADLALVTTEALVDYVHARGLSRHRVRVLPCGVDRSFLESTQTAKTADPDCFTLGFVGSLKPWHGVEILLQAFAGLRELSPVYRLLVVGDGPLMGQIHAYCETNGLDDAVSLVGAVPHSRVPYYLAQMDAGIAPYPPMSSFYFSPLKIWEYAAGRVPIVASASGEIPTLFPHRSAALLHEPGKVGKIVKHVERLRRDPQLGERLARRARAVAKEHTWDRLAGRFLTLADRLVVERQNGAGGGSQGGS